MHAQSSISDTVVVAGERFGSSETAGTGPGGDEQPFAGVGVRGWTQQGHLHERRAVRPQPHPSPLLLAHPFDAGVCCCRAGSGAARLGCGHGGTTSATISPSTPSPIPSSLRRTGAVRNNNALCFEQSTAELYAGAVGMRPHRRHFLEHTSLRAVRARAHEAWVGVAAERRAHAEAVRREGGVHPVACPRPDPPELSLANMRLPRVSHAVVVEAQHVSASDREPRCQWACTGQRPRGLSRGGGL